MAPTAGVPGSRTSAGICPRQTKTTEIRRSLYPVLCSAGFALLLSGCGGKKQANVRVPSPPTLSTSDTTPVPSVAVPSNGPGQNTGPGPETLTVPPGAKPIFVQTGLASWYGAPYHNRRGSNGKVYDMNAMTAAHRTIPLGSIVRVTNVKTGHATLVRITDRGPFIPGRVLDLSMAAAKAVDVWLAGIATIRLEVLETPAPLDQGGRWAVQIGAFPEEEAANALVDQLSRRYRTAKVLRFSSPVGDWWVRVRVLQDDRRRAEEIVHDTKTPQGAVFLVRLD